MRSKEGTTAASRQQEESPARPALQAEEGRPGPEETGATYLTPAVYCLPHGRNADP